MSHLNENETKSIQDMEVFKQYDFFPLLCQFYGRHKTGDFVRLSNCSFTLFGENGYGNLNSPDISSKVVFKGDFVDNM
jgi:hypothetical protein